MLLKDVPWVPNGHSEYWDIATFQCRGYRLVCFRITEIGNAHKASNPLYHAMGGPYSIHVESDDRYVLRQHKELDALEFITMLNHYLGEYEYHHKD